MRHTSAAAEASAPTFLSAVVVTLCLLALGACTDSSGRDASGSSMSSATVVLDLADRARASGDYASAIALYRRAVELNPNLQPAEIGLGGSLLDSGAPNEAAEAFRAVLAKAPDDAQAQTGLGEALLALDQPLAAIERLHGGLAAGSDPRGFRALCVAEDLLGHFPQAVADCERGLASTPEDLALRDDLGLSQVLAGAFDNGIAQLRAAASASGATAQHRLNLALGLGLAGRMDEAARVAKIDLDERSVASNLAYYATLRALPPQQRAEALLRPGTRPPLVGSTVVR